MLAYYNPYITYITHITGKSLIFRLFFFTGELTRKLQTTWTQNRVHAKLVGWLDD